MATSESPLSITLVKQAVLPFCFAIDTASQSHQLPKQAALNHTNGGKHNTSSQHGQLPVLLFSGGEGGEESFRGPSCQGWVSTHTSLVFHFSKYFKTCPGSQAAQGLVTWPGLQGKVMFSAA